MKLLLLALLALLLKLPPAGAPAVRVTLSPLTKAAYLAAKKGIVTTRPVMTFPLKKVRGRIVIPTAKGSKVFQDKGIGTDDTEQSEYVYQGYTPQFGYHAVEAHLYERTQWYLLDKQGKKLEFYNAPVYSPDMKYFVVSSPGIEYEVYPNELRLFRFENGHWQQVWKLEPSVGPATWEPEEIHWLFNSTLLLKTRMWSGKTQGNAHTYSKLSIQ